MEQKPRYRMPAEWEPHEATWLTWPHAEEHWPGNFGPIPKIWARMVKELEEGEDVHILIGGNATEKEARAEMKAAGVKGDRVHMHAVQNDFAWARDHGPIFVKDENGEAVITDWRFNGWGGKWKHETDDRIPFHVSEITGIPRVEIPMVLEGGSIDVNGEGSLLTTENCLLNPNRNPQLSKEQIEANLREYLGVTNILWLGEGIVGDDTDGHIDDLTRFIGPKTVFTVLEEDPADQNYRPLQENVRRLRSMKDQNGNDLEIVAVPMPKPVIHEDMRLPASYANFYIGNAVVLLPVYKDPNDQIAIDALAKAFPTRNIIPIDCTEMIWGLGSFHCVTQQQPAS